ncbi:Protoporphyrinogen IX oxidase, menaquinone-dependent (flavodoxin domain) [Cognatiyoonia sediminum]|uniref:Protoporphyrinogen IX oxidase, menaquinone-dependent (Flavodoxin domain) n=1 Tax=Cognatiyoonia sediminum TaxID=1508389 RepID=A0A1M5LPT0_9RHOB|nr:flavodoxin domain-containing protein [Cognatiyoonia sediminum]SHG67061.1 Protoporphyrinogen IX oxidase, menaquinone-dependent (flavodoxin domain) [Cognatiyoonia sediminum]
MANQRVLVTYAIGHGSTASVAGLIAEGFKDFVTDVDVLHIDAAANPNRYDAVVIGSPIRYDRCLRCANAYVEAHELALATRPVAYFFTCMALSVPSGNAQGRRYAERIAAQNRNVTPVCIGQFAGALDFEKFPGPMHLPVRLLLKILGVNSGDFLDPDAIRIWSHHCFASFQLKETKETKL